MEAELSHLQKALNEPERPLMAVIGGAKVSTKIALLENLVKRVETLVIGGAMANTFLAAEGVDVGKSLYEPDHVETARKVIKLSTESGAAILLPTDVVVAKEFKANAAHRTVPVRQVAKDEMILDVGPATVEEFGKFLHNTRTLVWNGPFGAFETPPFDAGTVAAARSWWPTRTKAGLLLSVAGGGDTVSALNHAQRGRQFLVCLDGGRRLPGMVGRPGTAGRGRLDGEITTPIASTIGIRTLKLGLILFRGVGPASFWLRDEKGKPMSDAVQQILSCYESDNPGVKTNLARMLYHGRLGGTGRMVILPVDQGNEHGPDRCFVPNPPAYDPHYHFQLAIDAGLNAFASPLGMLEAGAATFAGRLPLILKANSANLLFPKNGPKTQAVTATVRDALRLGCTAVGLTIYPGSLASYDMFEVGARVHRRRERFGPADRYLVLSARRRHQQGRRNGHRCRRLCHPDRGAAWRAHHQSKIADRFRRGQGRCRIVQKGQRQA